MSWARPASGAKLHLVSWLSRPDENPFRTPVVSYGVLVSVAADGKIETSDDISVASDLRFPLEQNITDVTHTLQPDHSDWKRKLKGGN